MGTTYEALRRAERERLQEKGVRDAPKPLPPAEISDALLDFNESASSEADGSHKPDEEFRIFKVSKTIEEKLLIKFNAGIIKDIFKYKYLLEIDGPIRIKQINLFTFAESRGYLIHCNTQILLSILLDRRGEFVSIGAYSKTSLTTHPAESSKACLFDPAGSKAIFNKMLQALFNQIEIEVVESILGDVMSINKCRQISCENGDLVAINGEMMFAFNVKSAVGFSLFLDPKGNFVGLSFSKDAKLWKQFIQKHYTRNSQVALNIFDTRI
jgi:hypothetical protein